MGAYRFAIYWKAQIGLMVGYNYGFIVFDLPFLRVMINVTKQAKGTNF